MEMNDIWNMFSILIEMGHYYKLMILYVSSQNLAVKRFVTLLTTMKYFWQFTLMWTCSHPSTGKLFGSRNQNTKAKLASEKVLTLEKCHWALLGALESLLHCFSVVGTSNPRLGWSGRNHSGLSAAGCTLCCCWGRTNSLSPEKQLGLNYIMKTAHSYLRVSFVHLIQGALLATLPSPSILALLFQEAL